MVTDELISAYERAVKEGDEKSIGDIGEKIATQIDKAIDDSAGREAFSDLTSRVIAAIEK
jgi:hypothetical protein